LAFSGVCDSAIHGCGENLHLHQLDYDWTDTPDFDIAKKGWLESVATWTANLATGDRGRAPNRKIRPDLYRNRITVIKAFSVNKSLLLILRSLVYLPLDTHQC